MIGGTLPWLKTDGNKIVTEDGQEVILRGANIMRAEWDWKFNDKSMSWERRAIPELALHWHGNVLLRDFASDPVNNGNADYLGELDYLVSCLAKANNMYLILAWRSKEIEGEQPSMPDDDAKNALSALAARYKDQSHVMYALQVEPHDVDWSTLRPLFEDMVKSIRSAVVRPDVGPDEEPKNVPLVMIPGTNWSRDVSHAVIDPVTVPNYQQHIVYKTHPYGERPACDPPNHFQQWFGQVHDAGKPVFVGEFGPVDEVGGACMSMDDVRDLLAFTRERNIGWTAWILDFQADPLMNQADLSPTAPYGTTVQAEMLTTPPIP